MKKVPAFYQTEEIVLREINQNDAENIVRWRGDPNIYRYFKVPHKITIEEHLHWFEQSYSTNCGRRDFIVLSHAGESLGTVGVKWNKDTKTAEVSYLIAPEHRGHGWASKALYALCSYAKEQWKATMFIACVHQANIPSREFIKSLGFAPVKKEDDFIFYQKHL